MVLGHVDRGTKMSIYDEDKSLAEVKEYEAVFRYLEDDMLFVVQCSGLYNAYETLDQDTQLSVSFSSGPNIYTFYARAVEKMRGAGMLMIRQLSQIDTLNRRHFERDEFHCDVRIFGMTQSLLAGPYNEVIENRPDLTDITFDISSGGLCVITNNTLRSEHDPYYLILFSLSEKDRFQLPSMLVRRSLYHRTSIGRYDYGFEFLYENMPDEKARLSTAILTRKLAHQNMY